MSRLPLVAIIGRPNTGKSTLFNRMIGQRKAIESNVPGTTRDHVAHRIETKEIDYLLLDTGGMGGGTDDDTFEDDVHKQSLLAVEAADLILFTVNGREELTGSDQDIISILRKKKQKHVPVIIIVTKCDTFDKMEAITGQYEGLGIADEIIPTSGSHGLGVSDLEDAIINHLKKLHFEKINEDQAAMADIPKIAIVGKPNVGKSSLVNALMSDPQKKTSPKLVSDIPGTTRDSTDTIIRHQDRDYNFIDTAGLKRQSKMEKDLEGLSILRTIRSVEECHVAVLLLDASEQISRQDKRIANLVIESGKGLLIALNKIDLLTSEKKKEKMTELEEAFPFCRYAPVLPLSAKTRDGILKLFDLIDMIARNRLRRISQKELRRWFDDAIDHQPMGAVGTTKHLTQADNIPPTFVLFVKNPKEVQVSQLRYLDNHLRRTFDFKGTPIRWITKGPREH